MFIKWQKNFTFQVYPTIIINWVAWLETEPGMPADITLPAQNKFLHFRKSMNKENISTMQICVWSKLSVDQAAFVCKQLAL